MRHVHFLRAEVPAVAQKPIASPVDVVTQLTETHTARGDFVPDAPHLDGAESAFVNFAAGPSASILDRARDLLRSRPA
jgi:hypothetical protein